MDNIKANEKPNFVANYPHADERKLLSVPERLGATTDFTGRDVTIAYLDAGFYMHADIRDRIVLHVDATTRNIKEEKEVSHVDVTSWHGLMVSAIAAGSGRASGGYYRGLAPRSKLVLIKVSNPRMQVKEADIMRGLKWLLESHERFNIRIVNVSVGGDNVSHDPNHPLHKSVRQLVEAGVVVVISSGNHSVERLVPPASSPEAIIVGGYNDHNSAESNNWTAYRSNYGQAYDGTIKPDIIAPAEWIPSPILPETMVAQEARWLGALLNDINPRALKSLLKQGYQDLNLSKKRVDELDEALYEDLQNRIFAHKLINKFYQYVDGTSVAAPIVSSVIAQMLEANPNLDVEQIRSILQETALPIDAISSEQQGAGAIQVNAAVEMALQMSKK